MDYIHSLDLDKEISKYLTQYPPQVNVGNQSILMDARNLYRNIINSIPELPDRKQKFHQTTHIVFTDYPKEYQENNTTNAWGGRTHRKNPMDCTLGGCTYWGNFCLIYDRPNNDEGLRTTVHELGHSLELEHSFMQSELSINSPHTFFEGIPIILWIISLFNYPKTSSINVMQIQQPKSQKITAQE